MNNGWTMAVMLVVGVVPVCPLLNGSGVRRWRFSDDNIIMEGMEVESECYLELPIEKYHNRANKPLNVNKRQVLFVYKGYLSTAFQESPHQVEDTVSYDKVLKVSHFKYTKSHDQAEVVAISLKGDERPTISFRVSSEPIAAHLVALVIQKIKEFSNLPDFSDLLQHKEQIIDRIKETEPEYRDVFNVFNNSKRIPTQKLKVILFENHRLMREYMSAAISKGFELDREFLLAEIKEKPKKKPQVLEITEALEKYDVAKSLEGLRFQDDEKKLKFVPNSDDVDDDLFFSCLPEVKEPDIYSSFQEIAQEAMEIEPGEEQKVEAESDVTVVRPVTLPKPQKGRFRIDQPKEIFGAGVGKGEKRKEEGRSELNVDLAKRVTLILKLYYRLVKFAGTTVEEIGAIENELHRLLNFDPRPAPFLEIAISKAVKNILKWKRENSAYNK